MTMKKRIMALTAALIMTAGTGCSDTKDGNGEAREQKLSNAEVSKGRYIEEKVDSEGVVRPSEFANSEDHIFIDTSFQKDGKQGAFHRFSEGGGFKAEALKADIDPDSVYDAAAGPSGEVFCSLFGDDDSLEYRLITKEGTSKTLDFPGDEMLSSYEFSADGRLFLLDTSGKLYELNEENMQLTHLYTFEDGGQLDIAGDMIYVSSKEALLAYDIAKGSPADVGSTLESLWADCISNVGAQNYDIFAGGENELYLVCPSGIYRHKLGGSMTEQIVDGIYTDLGSADPTVLYGAADKDGSFIVSFADGSVKRYRYDPEAVNEFISELKIYALKNSKTLSQAVRIFSKKHPEIKLVLEIGMRSGITCEDAAKNLTAEIMSGSAPDLLMLDGLDTESFEAKGMLLDLSELADKWKPDEELFSNICEWNSEGGLYSVAARFGVPVLIARSDKIDGIESYSDMAKLIEERQSSKSMNDTEEFRPDSFARVVVGRVTGLYGNKMIKDGKPDEALIREMLESAKRINDLPEYGYYSFEEDYSPECAYYAGIMAGTDLQGYSEEICFTKYALNTLTSIHDENKDADIRFGVKDAPNSFVPVCELGICASSGNKDAAADFIRTALSESVQSSDTEDGLPVNKKSLEGQMTPNYDESAINMIVDDTGCERYMTISPPDETEQAKLMDYINAADTAVRLDEQTKSDIIEEGAAYLRGDTTLDEAVKRIIDKLELRMKE